MINKRLAQKFASWIGSPIPSAVFEKLTRTNVIIPYYHLVSDGDILHVKHLYAYKTIGQFKDDLDFLLTHYSPTGLFEILNWIKNGHHLPQRAFLLTFDDGFREIYDVIAPILLEKGIPAAFFISSGFLDNESLCYQHKASLLVERIDEGISPGTEGKVTEILWEIGISFAQISDGVLNVDYRHKEILDKIAEVLLVDFQGYLNNEQPYLTSRQVKKLIEQGFAIGGHSIDHPYYAALSLVEQLEQTIVSVKQIKEKFGLDYGAFAFPHNDTGVSQEFFRNVQESRLIDITFGTGGMVDGGLQSHKQRFSLEKPLLPAREIIAWQYARKLYRQLRGDFKRVDDFERART